jgi:hypothetical protein
MNGASAPGRLCSLRLGGGMVMLGGVVWLILSGLHGALPGAASEAVAHVEGMPWRLVHILTVVAVAMVAAGLAALAMTFMAPRAAVLGRAGASFAVPAAAVLGVGFAIDGFVLAGIADAYAADPAMRDQRLMQAEMVLLMIGATSFAFQTLFALAVTLLAAATLDSGEYPRWLCLLGLAGGAIWAVTAFLFFAQGRAAEPWLIPLPVVPIAVWLLGIGWLAWQRGDWTAKAA